MARKGFSSYVDLTSTEKVKIKTETDQVSDSKPIEKVNLELFEDIMIKVELESEDNSINKIETIANEENVGYKDHFKVELENDISGDQVGLQYLDFMNAYKSETVIKEEIFSGYDSNCNKGVLTMNNNPQEEFIIKEDYSEENQIFLEKKPFFYDNCDKSARHKNNKTKLHSCETCGKSFVYVSGLKEHERMHTGEKPHCCDTCGKSFSQKAHLKEHKTIHTSEKPYPCCTCGKTFSRTANLKQHERIHTGEKPYSCDACGKSFTQRAHLKYHKKIHSGETSFSCDKCGKSFTQASNLKKHEKIHTGEKSYSCDTCGKSFIQLINLKEHERIHTGEKPFSCDTCGKSFSRQSDLKKHKIIHTGETPYSCDACGELFARSSYLKKHFRIHDKEKIIQELNQNEINLPKVVRPRTITFHEHKNSTYTNQDAKKTNSFLNHELSSQRQLKGESSSLTTSNRTEYHHSNPIDQKSTMETNYNNPNLKKLKRTPDQKTSEEKSFIEIQIPETNIKEETFFLDKKVTTFC